MGGNVGQTVLIGDFGPEKNAIKPLGHKTMASGWSCKTVHPEVGSLLNTGRAYIYPSHGLELVFGDLRGQTAVALG